MPLRWVREQRPRWDDDKARVIGGAPPGALDVSYPAGTELPGDWFAAMQDDRAVGYGWLDSTWGGDTEILLAVGLDAQRKGVGAYILDNLEREAGERGTNYVYNTVRATHPDREQVHDWLASRGYRGSDSDTALRKRVGVANDPAAARPAAPAADRALPADSMAPGHEESGGYVNIEDHQY
jgi:GNAT superfamily N-acetyltransferase